MILELFSINPSQLLLAFVLDLWIGDPKFLPHPVAGIGYLISFYEKQVRKLPLFSEKGKGVLFFFAVSLTTLTLSLIVTFFLKNLSNLTLLGEILFIFLISQFLALKSLILAGKIVEKYIKEENWDKARASLIALVGRDPDKLHKRDMQKAILESYAENLNDGVIAPLFWLSILGFPGIVLYKTVNTLDSMVGYKNEKYLYFGWFSAKMDDLFNYLPARITAMLLVIATTFYLGLKNGKRALKWILKYASLHPSPNSGYPEAALAGALGVRLLGPAYYHGQLVNKPYLGEDLLLSLEQSIPTARKLLYLASFLWVIFILKLMCLRKIFS